MAKEFVSKQATYVRGMVVMPKSGKSDPQGAGAKIPSGKHNRDNPRLNGGGSHHVAEATSCCSGCNSTRDRDIGKFLHHLKHNLLSEKHIHFLFFIIHFSFHY